MLLFLSQILRRLSCEELGRPPFWSLLLLLPGYMIKFPFAFLKEVLSDLELQTLFLLLPALVVLLLQPPPADNGKHMEEFLLSWTKFCHNASLLGNADYDLYSFNWWPIALQLGSNLSEMAVFLLCYLNLYLIMSEHVLVLSAGGNVYWPATKGYEKWCKCEASCCILKAIVAGLFKV